MENYNFYFKTYKRVFNIAEYKIRKAFDKGKIIGEKYGSINNTLIVSCNFLVDIRWDICDSKGVDDLFHKFRNRSTELETNDKYIINEEFYRYFKSNKGGVKITYKELIYEIAIRKALIDIQDRIKDLNETYSKIYHLNLLNIELIKLPITDTEISQYKKQIEEHTIQENTNVKKYILIAGVELCMREFAFYLRLRRDYNKSNEKYKVIYDRVMFEHGDPFNEVKLGRKYSITSFYGYLKDENPKESNKFNCKDAIAKIISICDLIQEKNFKGFVKKTSNLETFCNGNPSLL